MKNVRLRIPKKVLCAVLSVIMVMTFFVPVGANATTSQPFTIPRTEFTTFPEPHYFAGDSERAGPFRVLWSRPGLITSSELLGGLNHFGRHVLTETAERLRQNGNDQRMDTLFRAHYAHGMEPVGDQFLQYRTGQRVLPVIEPLIFENRIVGEALVWVPQVEDFFIVSEFHQKFLNEHGGFFSVFPSAVMSFDFRADATNVATPTRSYLSNGNFDFDNHVYPFPYARRITVTEFQAGLTAARYLAGYRLVNGELVQIGDPPLRPIDPPSDWAQNAVERVGDLGILPESFRAPTGSGAILSDPRASTTREEFAEFAVRLYVSRRGGFDMSNAPVFTDTSNPYVTAAAYLGIVHGVGNNRFNPYAPLTRQEAAVMLARLANAIGRPMPASTSTFVDNPQIADWAIAAVGQMQASGIMGGVGGNRFSPGEPYTREQSVVTMTRLLDWLNR